MHKAH